MAHAADRIHLSAYSLSLVLSPLGGRCTFASCHVMIPSLCHLVVLLVSAVCFMLPCTCTIAYVSFIFVLYFRYSFWSLDLVLFVLHLLCEQLPNPATRRTRRKR
jgi:hypothetical protein